MTNPSVPTLSPRCVCGNPECAITFGFCHCGCGKMTTISSRTGRRLFQAKGMPVKYLAGHAHKVRTLEERFWEKVNKNGPIVRVDLGPCWLWTGSTDNHGYGTINPGGGDKSPLKAHRVSYEINHGSIDPELEVMHQCDNPPCVNPVHLSQGDHFDNMRDAAVKGRVRSGLDHHMAKFPSEQVKSIRLRYATGSITQLELANEFHVSDATICNIMKGHTYAHIK
jgi:hypothetical protein